MEGDNANPYRSPGTTGTQADPTPRLRQRRMPASVWWSVLVLFGPMLLALAVMLIVELLQWLVR